MKYIILIEDRIERQKQYLGENCVERFRTIPNLNIPQSSECRRYIENINDGQMNDLNGFNLIIIHRSPLNQKGLQVLSSYCKEHQKDLILFSGSNSQITYYNDNSQALSINSKDFYSESLIDFLYEYATDNAYHLLKLIYGESWMLSYLMKYRQLSKIVEKEESPENRIFIEEKLNEIRKITKIEGEKVNREINQIIAKM